MKEIYTFFALISRMKYVRRWGLMHNVRSENLMEHSFETAVIAGALAAIENERFGGEYDADRVTMMALYHDATEIITGDMPTPVKYINEDLNSEYKKVEKRAAERLLCTLPEDLRGSFETCMSPDEKTRRIVKAADKISALIKCTQETEQGNVDFATALKSTEEKVRSIDLESVKYFMEFIFPAYRLTLDELTEEEK